MEQGYHAIGHALLEYWEERKGTDAACCELLRDFRLLVALLDHEVGVMTTLIKNIRENY